MDGRDRAVDTVCVERLGRTVQYEEVYLRAYNTVREAQPGGGRTAGVTTTSVSSRPEGIAHPQLSTVEEGTAV